MDRSDWRQDQHRRTERWMLAGLALVLVGAALTVWSFGERIDGFFDPVPEAGTEHLRIQHDESGVVTAITLIQPEGDRIVFVYGEGGWREVPDE